MTKQCVAKQYVTSKSIFIYSFNVHEMIRLPCYEYVRLMRLHFKKCLQWWEKYLSKIGLMKVFGLLLKPKHSFSRQEHHLKIFRFKSFQLITYGVRSDSYSLPFATFATFATMWFWSDLSTCSTVNVHN